MPEGKDMKSVEGVAQAAQEEVEQQKEDIAFDVMTWAGALTHKSVEAVSFDYGNGEVQTIIRPERPYRDPLKDGV